VVVGVEEQLVQREDFHSLDRLSQELVLVGVKAELVQLAGPRLAQLQLGVGAQDCDHVGGGHRHQLVQLRLAQLVQLQLDVQVHQDGVGGGGQKHRHHAVLQSQQQEWKLWQLWL
jgi:hypothetical protein